MTTNEIKIELLKRNTTQRQLCKKWRLKKSDLSGVINKHFHSLRIETKLAEFLGVSLEELRGKEPVPGGDDTELEGLTGEGVPLAAMEEEIWKEPT